MLDNDKANRALVLHKMSIQLPDADQEQLEDFVDRAELYFFARTNRRAVPVRAMLLWVDLAVRMYKQNLTRESGGADQDVASIKRGDTTIQFASASQQASLSGFTDLDKRMDFYRVVRAR